MASVAALVGGETKNLDSQNLLDVFMGKSDVGRESLIIEANTRTALRKGDYLMIPPYDQAPVNTEVNIV